MLFLCVYLVKTRPYVRYLSMLCFLCHFSPFFHDFRSFFVCRLLSGRRITVLECGGVDSRFIIAEKEIYFIANNHAKRKTFRGAFPFSVWVATNTNGIWEKRKEIYDISWAYLNSHKLNLSFFSWSDACKESIENVAKLLSQDHLSDVNRFLQINWNDDKKSFFAEFSSSLSRTPSTRSLPFLFIWKRLVFTVLCEM